MDIRPHQRQFLFLQGLSTPLFWKLGNRLRATGVGVSRVHFCSGDRLFWPTGDVTPFAGRFSAWAPFITRLFEQKRITDIVLFGAYRPYHRVAIARARRRGIRVHIFDEGYLRPHWITMEQAGMRWRPAADLAGIIEAAGNVPAPLPPRHVAGGFAQRAGWDVALHVTNIVAGLRYPFYRRHRPQHPLVEAIGWCRKSLSRRRAKRDANAKLDQLVGHRIPYYLLPLQLDSDSQIRFRSPFSDMGEVLHTVLKSFAHFAPPTANLAVKIHPLDNGVVDRHGQIAAIARQYGLTDRVWVLDGGHLPTLLDHALGVTVVNSTVGLTALHQKRPVIALAQAVYSLPGLTFDGPLDRFWEHKSPPDPDALRAFEVLVMHHTQINGSYFNFNGMDLAVDGIVQRLGLDLPTPVMERAPLSFQVQAQTK